MAYVRVRVSHGMTTLRALGRALQPAPDHPMFSSLSSLLRAVALVALTAAGGCTGHARGESAGHDRAPQSTIATSSPSGSAAATARARATPAAGQGEAGVPGAAASASAAATGAVGRLGPLGGDSQGWVELGTGCPAGMAPVARFCIDRWEAHLVVRASDGGEHVHPHVARPDGGAAYEARTAAGVYPQAYISRVEAEAACKQAGKRLCSFDEWRRACRGRKGYRHPYGLRQERGRCNISKPHLLPQMFGTDSRRWKYDDHFNSPRLNGEPGYLARTGEYERCATEDGIYDLVGNLHEWVRGTVTDELMAALERDEVERDKQPWHVGNGIFLGGFYSTTNEHGPGCVFTTVAHEPRYHDYSTGFRCCADAPLVAQPKARKTRPNPATKR